MFLHLSVSHSVHRGGCLPGVGVYPSMHWADIPPADTPLADTPGRHPPRSRLQRVWLQRADFFPSKSLIAMFKCLVTTSNHLSQAVLAPFLLVVSGTYYKSDDSFSLHTYRRVLFESHSLMQQRLIMIMLPLKCTFFSLVHCGETNSNTSWKYLSIQQRLATVCCTKRKLRSLTVHLY